MGDDSLRRADHVGLHPAEPADVYQFCGLRCADGVYVLPVPGKKMVVPAGAPCGDVLD